MTEDTPRPIERLARAIWPDTGKALGLSRNSVYQGVKNGDIPSIKVGGRQLVPEWFFTKLKNGERA
jgi:predicted DNA-binding transcriptional regulator AlpA